MIIYEFLYNGDCCDCCESAAATMSIHKTRKGAEMALEFHQNEIKTQWEEDRLEYGKDDPHYYSRFDWDFDQWWGIRESELIE